MFVSPQDTSYVIQEFENMIFKYVLQNTKIRFTTILKKKGRE